MTEWNNHIRRFVTCCAVLALSCPAMGVVPNRPVITEVYTDPAGGNDGPVGRDPTNLHQEYIEIYLPTCGQLGLGLSCSGLNMTVYEVEGDSSSCGLGLVNYRFDLPTFCVLDNAASCPGGTIPRPSSGVVVLGWVDYVGDPPTALAGTPSTRIGLINGGITSATNFVFIAINGHHFGGTTNFPVLLEENLIDLPDEALSGIVQNGSSAYLLVNRNSAGYVELCDDQHSGDCAAGSNPDLPDDVAGGLATNALLDGLAGNDDSNFIPADQPLPACDQDPIDCIDLQTVLPEFGAFSLLVAQIQETVNGGLNPGQANGYARVLVDVLKTTESAVADDPAVDAQSAYRHIRNDGPFFPTPGRAVLTTSPPELGVAKAVEQSFEVLKQTTGRPGVLAANVGGNFGINISSAAGASNNPNVATFGPGSPANGVGGQSLGFPSVAVTPAANAAHGQTASATVTVTASNTSGGDPAVLSPMQTTTVTATVLNPTTGQNSAGGPFQTTVFAAVQGIVSTATANEFAGTSLGGFLASQPDITALETEGHGAALLNAVTNISDPVIVDPWIKELPNEGDECIDWLNPTGAPGELSLVQTILTSAEVASGATTYEGSIGVCDDNGQSVAKAIRLNVPDTKTYDGMFSPSEAVHFANGGGDVANPRSGLTNATTSRTFEVAVVDTAVKFDGSLETGESDDFGIIIEVEETEPGSPVVTGEYVFLSFSGGLQGADIDSLNVPPGNILATIILLDLDNLHSVLGIRSIESLYIIDADAGSEVDFIEAFSLNLSSVQPACPADINGDNVVNANDLALLLGGWGPNPGHPADFNDDGVVNASDLALLLGAWGACN